MSFPSPLPRHAPAAQLGFRQERKYYLTPSDAAVLRQRVAWLLCPDAYSQDGPYHISSLYFDDIYDTALRQKQCGALVRDKWRVRWYNGATAQARLERKHKCGDLSRKEQTWLNAAQFERLNRGDCACAAGEDAPVWRALYAAWLRSWLRPVVRVDYDREAFSYTPGNVRVTFDNNLRAARPGAAFSLPVQTDGLVILELKCDGFLPSVVAGLFAGMEFNQLSISKYVMARFCLMEHGCS